MGSTKERDGQVSLSNLPFREYFINLFIARSLSTGVVPRESLILALHRRTCRLQDIYAIGVERRVSYSAERCNIVILTLGIGHWIQDCPTNDDPNFDGRPRVKRTTGIPRSFLKTIAKPVSLSNDGLTDMSKQPSGVMVNAEGEFVVAEPDKASWEQFQARNKASEVAQQIADKGSKELQDRGLECSIDKRMFVEPTKTPCCGQTYCNDCITNALIEGDLVCPNCQKEGILLDDLVPDHEVAAKLKAYRAEKEEQRSREASKSRSGSPRPKGTEMENGKTLARTMENSVNAEIKPEDTSKNHESPKLAETTTKIESPKAGKGPNRSSTSTPAADSTTSTGSKKRAASDDLENLRIPKAPAAMRNMIQQQAQAAHRYGPTNYNGGYNSNVPYQPMAAGQNNFYAQGTNPMMMAGGGGTFMGMPTTMGGMMGMDTSMMNPMMGFGGMFNGANGMSGMNGMGGGPNMPIMNMYAPFNNSSAGMMANSMGYPSMPISMPMGMNGNSYPTAGMPQQHLQNNAAQANFPNQQRSVGSGFVGSGNGIGGVMGGALQAEEGAYFRQPVNPNRHQSKNRRVRPSDYHEV